MCVRAHAHVECVCVCICVNVYNVCEDVFRSQRTALGHREQKLQRVVSVST